MSTQDYEKFGRHLLNIDPKLARSYLELSRLPHEAIEALVSSAGKKIDSNEKGKKIMDSEDFIKMAEECEMKFKKTGNIEYQEMARAYRKEAEGKN